MQSKASIQYWAPGRPCPRTAAADVRRRAFRKNARNLTESKRLAELKLYGGAVDGDHGPLTKQAVKAFQRAWLLGVDGRAGAMTQRTLAYVTAVRA